MCHGWGVLGGALIPLSSAALLRGTLLCRTYLQALEPHIFTPKASGTMASHTSEPALANKQRMRKRGCYCNILPPAEITDIMRPATQFCTYIKTSQFHCANLRILSASYSSHTVEQPEARSHFFQESEAWYLSHHRAGWPDWRKKSVQSNVSSQKSVFMWEGIVWECWQHLDVTSTEVVAEAHSVNYKWQEVIHMGIIPGKQTCFAPWWKFPLIFECVGIRKITSSV